MNKQGVFITFMVFLLAAAVILLYSKTGEIASSEEELLVNEAVFDAVNDSFNNLFEEVIALNKEGYAKEVQQRPMPFGYNLNDNSIAISQTLPARTGLLESYLDALNIYSIFANEQEQTGNLQISTAVIAQSSDWEPGSPQYPDLNYLILPQCLFFDLNSDGNMALRAGTDNEVGCEHDFGYADINAVDVNVFFDSTPYTDGTLSCTGAFSGCQQQLFDPLNPNPYIVVRLDELCGASAGCKVTTTLPLGRNQKVIAGHFNPEGNQGTVSIQATGDYVVMVEIGASSIPVHVENQFLAEPIEVELNVSFDQKIQLFYFTGFSITAGKHNFPILRST